MSLVISACGLNLVSQAFACIDYFRYIRSKFRDSTRGRLTSVKMIASKTRAVLNRGTRRVVGQFGGSTANLGCAGISSSSDGEHRQVADAPERFRLRVWECRSSSAEALGDGASACATKPIIFQTDPLPGALLRCQFVKALLDYCRFRAATSAIATSLERTADTTRLNAREQPMRRPPNTTPLRIFMKQIAPATRYIGAR